MLHIAHADHIYCSRSPRASEGECFEFAGEQQNLGALMTFNTSVQGEFIRMESYFSIKHRIKKRDGD
jgi:hypothetical protein